MTSYSEAKFIIVEDNPDNKVKKQFLVFTNDINEAREMHRKVQYNSLYKVYLYQMIDNLDQK